MSPEKQRIAIAEACGYFRDFDEEPGFGSGTRKTFGWRTRTNPRLVRVLPDYLSDLNAMHEAEKKFQSTLEKTAYFESILMILFDDPAGDGSHIEMWGVCSAPANVRAEAFLRTIGKWEDDNSVDANYGFQPKVE